MRDLTIVMDTTLGRPADILEGLAAVGVRVVAGCLFPRLEGRVAHITVPDEQAELVHKVVAEHGASVLDEREVLVVPPGKVPSPADIARKVADAGVMVWVSYFGAAGEVVLGASDLARAREALGLDAG
jgi:hypothetical protein